MLAKRPYLVLATCPSYQTVIRRDLLGKILLTPVSLAQERSLGFEGSGALARIY